MSSAARTRLEENSNLTTQARIRLASRLSRVEPSPTLQVSRRAKELADQGIEVIDLGPGEPDFVTPDPIREAAKRAIDAGFTKYTDAAGCAELRRAISADYNRRYGTKLSPKHVIAGSGGKQELFNLMFALVEEGDEVVIPVPYWVSFPAQVALAGGTPVYAQLDPAEGFRPTAEAIADAVTDRTRVVILNSPSNPSGAVVRHAELEAIVELCHERGIVLVSDETYEYFVYDEEKHFSAAEWFDRYPETVVLVNSFSKTWAMTGWRIGYAVATPEIVSALSKIQSHSTSNPSSISQLAAVAAYETASESVATMLEAYRERRAWLVSAIREIPGFRCEPPGGAFYVYPNVSSLYGKGEVRDSVTFADYLLREARVAVVPGIAFGTDDYVRISYATSMDLLERAVSAIDAAVRNLG